MLDYSHRVLGEQAVGERLVAEFRKAVPSRGDCDHSSILFDAVDESRELVDIAVQAAVKQDERLTALAVRLVVELDAATFQDVARFRV